MRIPLLTWKRQSSAVDRQLTAVNFTFSGEIQDVDTGLTALCDTVAELEGRMENLEDEFESIEVLIHEIDGRLTKLEVPGNLVLTTGNHHRSNCYGIDIVNNTYLFVSAIYMYALLHVYLYRNSGV